jgi:ribosomal protein S18 acetylase RimI-like enzyme
MTNDAIEVKQATVEHLDLLVPLFDAYRQFYRQPSEPERARQFLLDRFERNQSVIFLAFDSAGAIGFTQLYPSFSSGAMARIFVLNDLFVIPEARRRGVGSALLRTAAEYGRRVRALRLTLSTEVTNVAAQAAYEALGWKRDLTFYVSVGFGELTEIAEYFKTCSFADSSVAKID